MRKTSGVMITLVVMLLFSCTVAGVVFADDHIRLVENGESVSENQVIITAHTSESNEVFEAVYDGDEFACSQVEVLNLSFYWLNESQEVMDFSAWHEVHPSANYSMYVGSYISALISESDNKITVSFPDPQDNSTHGGLFGMGGVVGSHRYFTVNLQTGNVTLTDVQTPETPGFEFFIFIVAVGIMVAMWWDHNE